MNLLSSSTVRVPTRGLGNPAPPFPFTPWQGAQLDAKNWLPVLPILATGGFLGFGGGVCDAPIAKIIHDDNPNANTD